MTLVDLGFLPESFWFIVNWLIFNKTIIWFRLVFFSINHNIFIFSHFFSKVLKYLIEKINIFLLHLRNWFTRVNIFSPEVKFLLNKTSMAPCFRTWWLIRKRIFDPGSKLKKLIVVWLLIQYTVLWRHRQYNLMNRYNCSHHKYILNPIAMAESMIVSHLDFKTDRQTA